MLDDDQCSDGEGRYWYRFPWRTSNESAGAWSSAWQPHNWTSHAWSARSPSLADSSDGRSVVVAPVDETSSWTGTQRSWSQSAWSSIRWPSMQPTSGNDLFGQRRSSAAFASPDRLKSWPVRWEYTDGSWQVPSGWSYAYDDKLLPPDQADNAVDTMEYERGERQCPSWSTPVSSRGLEHGEGKGPAVFTTASLESAVGDCHPPGSDTQESKKDGCNLKLKVPIATQVVGPIGRPNTELRWGPTALATHAGCNTVRASSSAPLGRQPRSEKDMAQSPSHRPDEGKVSLAGPWACFSKARARAASAGPNSERATSRGRSTDPAYRWTAGIAPERVAVMLNEVVEVLIQAHGPDATYVDCTFGRGGHASEILRQLSPEGRLIGFDVDPLAIAAGRSLERADERFQCHHRPCGDLTNVVDESVLNLGGVLIDLGSYATQAEERSRGFSAVDDGPLDLRYNPGYGLAASAWLQTVTVQELAWVIYEYGEDNDELMSMRLAEGILERQRRLGPYKSTLELADVCREVKQGIDDRGQHPAKLTFQALRSFLNHETEQLQLAMHGAMQRLQPGGRCVIITYRKKEAVQVKRFVREHEEADPRFAGFVTMQRLTELYPLLSTDYPWSCRQTCEPLRPCIAECDRNPRARSAVIHILTKEARDFSISPSCGLKPRPEQEQFKKPAPLPFQGSANLDVVDFSDVASFGHDDLKTQAGDDGQNDHDGATSSVAVGDEAPAKIIATQGPFRDWICPHCGDLQWARRPRCRLCGCAPPGSLG